MTIYLLGMCYAGKTTLGRLLGERLNKKWLDSRDLFKETYGITEIEFLSKYGQQAFIKAEEESLLKDFGDMVISLGGSAVYYTEVMNQLCENHTVIWLNVPFEVIKMRKENEFLDNGRERPIVYPIGIFGFDDLYNTRKELYNKSNTHEVKVEKYDTPESVLDKIISIL